MYTAGMTGPVFLFLQLVFAGGARGGEYRAYDYLHGESGALFRKVETSTSCVYAAAREFAFTRPFACVKPARTKRVFLIGNSLVKSLEPPSAPKDVEIVPCGVPGWDSRREVGVAREVLGLEPDLIVVLTGGNEGEPEPGPLDRLRAAWRRARGVKEEPGAPALPRPRAQAAFDEVAAEAGLAANLLEIARAARAARVPLVFATSPLGADALPPPLPEPFSLPGYLAARLKAQEGGRSDAAIAMQALAERAPEQPHVLFWRGRGLLAAGRREEGRRALREALQLSGFGRMTPGRNEAVRRVARAEGAGLVDLEAVYDAASREGVAGLDLLLSDVHWRKDRRGLAADAVFGSPAVSSVLGKIPAWGARRPPPDPIDAPAYGLGAGLVEWAETGRWQEPPRLWERVVARAERAFAAGVRERGAAALWKEAVRAASSDPFWENSLPRLEERRPAALAHWAEALRRRGECGPAAALADEAVRLEPGSAPARWARALLAAGCGRPAAEALADLMTLPAASYPEAAVLAELLGQAPARPRADRDPQVMLLPVARGSGKPTAVAWERYREDCGGRFAFTDWEGGASWVSGYGTEFARAASLTGAFAAAAACADGSPPCARERAAAAEGVCRERWEAARRSLSRHGPAALCSGRAPSLESLARSHGREWSWDRLDLSSERLSYGVGCYAYVFGLVWGRRPGADPCAELAGLPPYKWIDPAPLDVCRASAALGRVQAAAARGAADRAACREMLSHVGRFERLTSDPERFCAVLEEGYRARDPEIARRLVSAGLVDAPKIYGFAELPENLLLSFFAGPGAPCSRVTDPPKRRQCEIQSRFAGAAGDAAAAARAYEEAARASGKWFCELARAAEGRP